jgi:hypothetical protein
MRKHGLKILGLAVMAVLGLMALSASAASAATTLSIIMEPNQVTAESGEFLINTGTTNPTINKELKAGETIAAESTKEGRLLIPEKAAEIDCAKAKLVSGTVSNEYEDWALGKMKNNGHGKGEAIFEECKVFKALKDVKTAEELTGCTKALNSATTPGKVVATGLLRVVKHENTGAYLVLEPQINSAAGATANKALTSTFTTVNFPEPNTCSLPTKNIITGGIVVSAPTADAVKPEIGLVKTWELEGEKVVASVEQKLFGALLKFGANEAFLEAKEIKAELTGTCKACSWGAM